MGSVVMNVRELRVGELQGGGAARAGVEWEGTESGREEGRRVRPRPGAPFGLETGWGRKRGSLLTLG